MKTRKIRAKTVLLLYKQNVGKRKRLKVLLMFLGCEADNYLDR